MSDSEENQKKNYDHLFKVILTGDAKVGKTSLKKQYVDNNFSREYRASSGIDFAVKNILSGKKQVCLMQIQKRNHLCLMNGWMTCDFTSFLTVKCISVIAGRCSGDNERLCAVELRLRLRRFPLE